MKNVRYFICASRVYQLKLLSNILLSHPNKHDIDFVYKEICLINVFQSRGKSISIATFKCLGKKITQHNNCVSKTQIKSLYTPIRKTISFQKIIFIKRTEKKLFIHQIDESN